MSAVKNEVSCILPRVGLTPSNLYALLSAAMDGLPLEVKEQLKTTKNVVDELEATVTKLVEKSRVQANDQSSCLKKAEVHLALAQSIAALLRLLIQIRGKDPSDYKFDREEKRIHQYQKKVRKALAEDETKKRTLEVDVAALNRFISASLPELSAEQRNKLKSVEESGKQRKGEPVAGEKKKKRKSEQKKGVGHKEAALAFLQESFGAIEPKSNLNSDS